MAQIGTLRRMIWHMPGWQMYLSQLHDEAGLDVWDEDLINTAVADVHAELEQLVGDLHKSPSNRAMVLAAWREGKEKAPALATTGACMAG